MKSIYTSVQQGVIALFIISTSAFLTPTASGQCNTSAGGNGSSIFAVSPITINGDMTDWNYYFQDADNTSLDNIIDLDAPISDASRGLEKLTFTQNLTNLFINIERTGSSNNTVNILFYVDINNNDQMELNEPVVHFNWSGANRRVDVRILNYIPSALATQNSLSLNQDGRKMGGKLETRTTFVERGTGAIDGKSMEVSIPLSLLTQVNGNGSVINQLQAGQSFKYHLSTLNGNISSVPGQNSIHDNMGGCLTGPQAGSPLPVTLLNFDAILKTDKVNLSWTTTDHTNFSHFVLQRSSDGKNFKDVVTMTHVTVNSAINLYNYKDDVNGMSNMVYYRLQMVDVDTKFQYSPVRMVRLNAANTVKIQTFPNPVTSELRVTIPTNWQEKTTTYEIYNSNGSLINRTQIARAPQVQQFNVQSLGSGNYIIRVTNGQEVSSSKFVKY
ncbi:MAG: T9SS type A sorting domain-containing protein [Chitinophagaceae bacterium]|jgi:hypothetical protein